MTALVDDTVVKEKMSALVSIEADKALAFFTIPNAFDPLLESIRKEIECFVPDISTVTGRKAVASMAYKVAQTKTYLDGVGKELVAKQKEIPNKIDATRKRLRDTLDKWRDEVRSPLTLWEAAESDRLDRIQSSLAELKAVADDMVERSAEAIRDRLREVECEAITEQFYQEFTTIAAELKDKAITALRNRFAAAEKREAEQAELARLRAEEAARKAREREDQIARDAAERAAFEERRRSEAASRAAEDAARREQEAAERRELELKLKAEQAERRAAEAEAKAKRDAEAERARLSEGTARREANQAHRARVNKAVLVALVGAGLDEKCAKGLIQMIVRGEVPHVSILY